MFRLKGSAESGAALAELGLELSQLHAQLTVRQCDATATRNTTLHASVKQMSSR